MAIVSNSNGAINFRLGTGDDEPKNGNSVYTNYVIINGEANRLSIKTSGRYMGAIQGEIASGTFTLFVTQDEVTVNKIVKYRGSVIKIVLGWSISFTEEYSLGNKIKRISFTCLEVRDVLNNNKDLLK